MNIEAMKIETAILSPYGVVKEIPVSSTRRWSRGSW
jgi:biotin carboxyl carrier protein